jgi:hypothetical protein
MMSNDKVKSAIAVGGAFLVVLAIGTIGWTMLAKPSSDPAAIWQEAAAHPSTTPTVTLTTDPTTPPPSSAAPTSKPPATKKAPLRTTPPPKKEQPPAQVEQPADPNCTGPTFEGVAASRTEVKNLLVAAAGKQYWQGVVAPDGLTPPLPKITVPADLVKALAYQESGWQSNIIACDGGVGPLQIMANTQTQVNNRFGESYDSHKLADNIAIGVTYLEWLVMYFGLFYYGQNFDLTPANKQPIAMDGTDLELLDVVLAAYNLGPAGLEGSTDPNSSNYHPGKLAISTKGWNYLNNVEALRTNCECLSW